MNNREKALRDGGKKLSAIFSKTLKAIKAGKSLIEINKVAEKEIAKAGLKASFKTVRNYQWATCLNLNDGVVHGVPNEREISRGDLISLDLGVVYGGWHTDMAYTLEVGTNNFKNFLKVGQEALEKAISQAKAGGYVGDISQAIQTTIEGAGYAVVSQLTGHATGKTLHESPNIPGVLVKNRKKTEKLRPGMALAIEVIYSQGNGEIKVGSDGWTISTQDGKIAALFEKTILIGQKQAEELTPYSWNNVQE